VIVAGSKLRRGLISSRRALYTTTHLVPRMSAPPPPPIVIPPLPDGPAPSAPGDGEPDPRPRPRSSISTFFFLSFIFFFITNNSSPDDLELRLRASSSLDSLKWQVGNFTAWLNGTDTPGLNFSMPETLPSEVALLHRLQPSGVLLDPMVHTYFPNITGFIRGSSAVYNISPAAAPPEGAELPAWARDAAVLMQGVNLTASTEKLGTWNWTAVRRIAVSALEKPAEIEDGDEEMQRIADGTRGIVPVHGHVELIDSDTEDEMRLDFAGVHFLGNGSLYALAEPVGCAAVRLSLHYSLTTSPACSSAIDVRTVPALLPSALQNTTARALLPALHARIRALRALASSPIPTVSPVASEADLELSAPASHCAFHIYGQMAPANISAEDMAELEDETMEPTGRHVARRPPMLVDFVLLSRECGVLIRVERAEGLRSPLFLRKVTTCAYVWFVTR
jgi:hypothetical protein